MTTTPRTLGRTRAGPVEEVHVTGRRVVSVAYGLFMVGYYVLLEGYLGQTVGKMAVGIRVVAEGTGSAPGLAGAAVRTVLRLIDGLFSYAVAFVTVLVSARRKRLGDMAAHTLVIRT